MQNQPPDTCTDILEPAIPMLFFSRLFLCTLVGLYIVFWLVSAGLQHVVPSSEQNPE